MCLIIWFHSLETVLSPKGYFLFEFHFDSNFYVAKVHHVLVSDGRGYSKLRICQNHKFPARCFRPPATFRLSLHLATLTRVFLTFVTAQEASYLVQLQIFDHALVMIHSQPFPYPIPIVCNKDTSFYSDPVLLNPPPSL